MSEVHKGHRERMREEFRRGGFTLENYPPHKIIEMLLYYPKPRSDTNSLGHALINRFGSLSGVLNAPYEDLCEVDGVGVEIATYIKFILSLFREYTSDAASKENLITDIASAKSLMAGRFIGESAECVYLAALGNNGKLLFCKKITEGSPETVSISPSDIIKPALRANAVKLVLAHNHPNGICNPSNRDYHNTYALHDELARVELELVDHIIVAPDGVCSMKEQGMMPRK